MSDSIDASLRTVRKLGHADIAALQELDRAAHGDPWSHRTFVDEIDQPERLHLVAEDTSGSIVGHAAVWIDGPSCRITNVAVASTATGQGHASALLVAVVSAALEDSRVTNLLLEVRPANRRAQRLYGRFGFVPVGIERDFYPRSDEHGSRDALVMAVADVHSETWRERLGHIDGQTNAGAAA